MKNFFIHLLTQFLIHLCTYYTTLLFLQKDGNPLDVKLLDFQVSKRASVVCDLAYFFYSGVSKDILDNLDYYLKIYHDSFANTLRSFNLDPATIFTFEDLKEEFTEYYSYGFILGQLALQLKLNTGKNLSEAIKETDAQELERNGLVKPYGICVDIVKHLYERKLL